MIEKKRWRLTMPLSEREGKREKQNRSGKRKVISEGKEKMFKLHGVDKSGGFETKKEENTCKRTAQGRATLPVAL